MGAGVWGGGRGEEGVKSRLENLITVNLLKSLASLIIQHPLLIDGKVLSFRSSHNSATNGTGTRTHVEY